MIFSQYFPNFKAIKALRAQAGYGFMKMNGCIFTPGDALALASAPLLLAGNSIAVAAIHLHTGAVGKEILSFGA
jgi:hypothetical protein